MVNIKFSTEFDKSKLRITQLTKNKSGKGSSAKVDYVGGNLFEGAPCKVNFSVKPGMDDTVVTDWMKLNLTMELNPETESNYLMKKKLEELDTGVCEFMLENKEKFLGDKAKHFKDADSLRGMLSSIVKDGKTSESGITYKPSFTIKVQGMSKSIDHLECEEKINKDGSKSQVVKNVVWKNFTDVNRVKGDDEIKFVIVTKKELDSSGKPTGRDCVTQKVVMTNSDGSTILDAEGNPIKRWVGPQDIKPGCIVKPLFSIEKVWYVATFGVHLKLEGLRIEPPAPKPVTKFDDAVEEDEDEMVSSQILKKIETRAEPEPPAADMPRDDENAPALDAPEQTTTATRKRKSDETDSPVAPKKKKTTKTLDDTA